MSRDEAGNCLCGIAVSLHFDDKNRMVGCEKAASRLVPVDRGRLFGLKLKKNHESRAAALKSIRELPDGRWQVRVGGAVRGVTVKVGSKVLAEQYAHQYYNEAMLAWVEHRKF